MDHGMASPYPGGPIAISRRDFVTLARLPTVENIASVAQIEAGFDHTCALEESGDVFCCWGLNSFGQLGDGSETSRSSPVRVQFD